MTRSMRIGFLWVLCALAAFAAPGLQVTLPLAQFEELRGRAHPKPDEPPPPPARYAVESADFEIVAGPTSARILQKLALTLYSDGWERVPLGEAGSFTSARFGTLEGRVEVDDQQGWALQVRGRGRHEVTLESVVPVRRDDTATRPLRVFSLRFPPAAVIRGRIEAPADIEEVHLLGQGMIRGKRGMPWSFVSAFRKDQGIIFNLYGERTLPERALLPLRFEATSATAALLSRTQLRVRGWIEARVAQGRLEELRIPVPAGLEIVSVNGPIAGWDVTSGTLVVTPLEPVERTLAVEVEMTAEPRTSFASPVLIPAGSRRTLPLVKAALQGDGLLTLADPGVVRGPEDTETARLPESVRGAGGRLLAVLDPARPPRWEAEWAGETEVLAAQVDRLLVDVAVGEAGRANVRLWAEIRNRGAQQLVLTFPAGFELTSARRDGEDIAPGVAPGGGLAVPLLTGDAAQSVHLDGILPLALPKGEGGLSIPLPALSAPAARVEVRVVLPGGRSYTLAEPSRAGRIQAPPSGSRKVDVTSNALASQVAYAPSRNASIQPKMFPVPPGYHVLGATWSALSATPGPLVIRVETEKEAASWF